MNLRLALLLFAIGASTDCFADGQHQYQTGNFVERVPLDSIVGEADVPKALDPGHEFEFDVYVPRDYDPSLPAGLLVYVSPIDSGRIPDDWKTALDRRNLLWVSVNDSGNSMPAERRIAEARISRAYMLQKYRLDPRRIYISGMSGGSRISGIVAPLHPDLFRGGIFLCGVNPWSERDADPWTENPPADFDTLRENRFVFLSGTEDFKLAATARVYRLYKKAGIDRSKLIVIDDMGHELPDEKNFDRALDFVDAVVD